MENPNPGNKNPQEKPPDLPSPPASETAAPKPQAAPAPKPQAAPVQAAPLAAKTEGIAEIITQPIDRRTFIKWSVIGWTAFAAVVGGYATMVMRFMFPNVLFEPVQTFKAGFPDEYPPGEVSERWKDRFAVWIVNDGEKIFTLSTVCTHLGCTPNWLGNENKFKCPCHGSGFYKTGINFEGPAPRPLERFKIVLADDGQILVDKTKKYQQEKGEWNDPESYLTI